MLICFRPQRMETVEVRFLVTRWHVMTKRADTKNGAALLSSTTVYWKWLYTKESWRRFPPLLLWIQPCRNCLPTAYLYLKCRPFILWTIVIKLFFNMVVELILCALPLLLKSLLLEQQSLLEHLRSKVFIGIRGFILIHSMVIVTVSNSSLLLLNSAVVSCNENYRFKSIVY